MIRRLIPAILLFSCVSLASFSQRVYTPSPVTATSWNAKGALNPFIPGYFADPTIRKFGDTYYLYATTDGTGNGYGPAQVWVSKDFCNWQNVVLNWPTTEVVWAPEVVQQTDGSYRYYYCEPCNVNVGASNSPLGPWRNILGTPDAQLVPDRYVHNAITLDPALFRDDDGSEYLYFGTWGIYDGFGCGCARLNPAWNEKSSHADGRRWNENNPRPIAADEFFSEKRLIPNTEIKDFFEAPYVFKRAGKYYFTYSSGSCHDDTYRVQYAVSTVSPMGPYEYKGCILNTNQDETVHGPGHHSILIDGEDYYIVYHRHNNPKSIHGFNRQICIDKLEFDANDDIKPVVPTHEGLLPASLAAKASQTKAATNLAYGAKVTASSTYSDWFLPEYAVDDNNATLWRAARTVWDGGYAPQWLQLDLGSVTAFNQVWTQFEYATFFYQYLIETSIDGNTWTVLADKTANVQQGSPMIDEPADGNPVKARYIRIVITDTQKNGHFPAVWNVKVYNATRKNNPKNALPDLTALIGDAEQQAEYLKAVNEGYPRLHVKDVENSVREERTRKQHTVLDINADDCAHMSQGKPITLNTIASRQGHSFEGQDPVIVEVKSGKYAYYFNGQQSFTCRESLPATMAYNAPYTMTAWVLNPSVSAIETIAEFTGAHNDLATIEFRNGTDARNGIVAHNGSFENAGAQKQCREGQGKWQHWAVTFDGYMESIYLNGELVSQHNNFLMIRPEGGMTIGSGRGVTNKFSGYIHSLQFFDRSFSIDDIKENYNITSDTSDRSLVGTDFTLAAEAVAPNLVSVSLRNADGTPINTGTLSYAFSTTSSKKGVGAVSVPSASPSALVTTDGKPAQYVKAEVYSDSGELLCYETAKIKIKAKAFVKSGFLGDVTLSGSHPDFNNNPLDNGAKIYATAEGDFTMQVQVDALDGEDKRQTPAYNEGGIIVLANDKQFVQLGAFPSYNCGDMLTVYDRGRRPQYPNSTGWRFDRYLQLQRIGDTLYARTSADGKTWTDMPGSPVTAPFVKNSLKLGIYQTTYTNNESWVRFKDLIINQKK